MVPFQLAAQEPDASGPHRALQQVLKRGRVESGILRLVHWPDRPQHQDPCRLTIREHEGAVRAVAYSPCGRWVASGSQDNTARICSVVTGEVKCTLKGHSGLVRSVAYSPDGKHIVSGSDDNTVKIWDSATGTLASVLPRGRPIVCCCVRWSDLRVWSVSRSAR